MSHMLDCQLFGTNPAAPHVINFIFHTANSILLFLLLFRMTHLLWQSWVPAAFFAFHPLHVESVAWIAERKDVLSAFFFFLCLLSYVRYVESAASSEAKVCTGSWYALGLVLFACGLLSKPMLVSLPFVLLLLDYWPLQRFLVTKNAPLTPSQPSLPKLATFNLRDLLQ